jgi:hypothetical protein
MFGGGRACLCYSESLADQLTVEIMSNNTPDPKFWERANAIINLSNDQCDAADPNAVAASTLYATARFNAFIVAKTTGSAQNMKLERERALDYFTEQFRQMMTVNLDDFIANFESFMAKDQG